MVTVLAVADGASEPLRGGPTSLEAAVTPTIDRLLRSGVLQRARTIGTGLLPGTEVGLPTLLGAAPSVQPGRGRIEAAAANVSLGPDEGAWRLDVVSHATPDDALVARADAALRRHRARLVHLTGHRCLLIGPAAWGDGPPGPHQTPKPLAEVATGPFARVVTALAAAVPGVSLWPWGSLGDASRNLPSHLGHTVHVVAAGGAAAGIARELGCTVHLAAPSAGAAVVEGADDDDVVVLHDARPDDAAHARDRNGKIAALARFDGEVVAPVVDVLNRRGGRLIVATDHGCDPDTGAHDAAPVPVVLWHPHAPEGGAMPRWTERHAVCLGVVPAEILLVEQLATAAA